MKKVTAIIQSSKLNEVKTALVNAGIEGMTIANVRGYGRQMGQAETYRGKAYIVEFISKIQVEVVIQDDQIDQVVETIVAAAQTGKIGDGKIFVTHVEEAVRIRTGERDAAAVLLHQI